MIDSWRWPNFTPVEMACKETGELAMLPSFMDRLQALRTEFGKPLPVSSGYRSRMHSAERKKKRPGPHAIGCAVDITVYGDEVTELICLAKKHGFTGIGVRQHDDFDKRFIHLDDCPATAWRPRPWFWSYP